MSAPLIDPEDKQPDEKLEIRLRPEVARDLRAYGEYANGSSVSHVASAALKRLFREDKGFRAWREAHPDAGLIRVRNIARKSAAPAKGAA